MRKELNTREIWNIAAKLDLGYLGYRLNEYQIKKLAILNLQRFLNFCAYKPSILVDCGCGICTWDVYWAKSFPSIVAFDASDEMIKHAKERLKHFGISNISLIIADTCHIPLRNKVGDVTVCVGVLKHLPNNPISTYLAIKEIIRITKNKGLIHIGDLPHIVHPFSWIMKLAKTFLTRILRRFTVPTYFYFPWHISKALRIYGVTNTIWFASEYVLFSPLLLPLLGKEKVKKLIYIPPLSRESQRYKSDRISLRILLLDVLELFAQVKHSEQRRAE